MHYHSKEELTFWLHSRQIEVPDRISQIRELVMFLDTKLGDTLQPIPKELMRGSSAYCLPVVLQPELIVIKRNIWLKMGSSQDSKKFFHLSSLRYPKSLNLKRSQIAEGKPTKWKMILVASTILRLLLILKVWNTGKSGSTLSSFLCFVPFKPSSEHLNF